MNRRLGKTDGRGRRSFHGDAEKGLGVETVAPSLIISLFGVLLDLVTTTIGLSLGFHEAHPAYHPLKALFVFWSLCILLTFALPKGRSWGLSKNLVSAASFLGAINNILVILN